MNDWGGGGSVCTSCEVFGFSAALSCNEALNCSFADIEFNCAAPADEL